MNLLSKSLANKVIREIKKVLPYHINIMNASGIIIASSDATRVGMLHDGALQCLRFKETVEIYKPQKNMLPGVNTPLYLDNAVLGVLGISGPPAEVRIHIDLVRIAAELLIEQANMERQRQHRRQSIDEFISEWVYSEPPYSQSLIERGNDINIPVSKAYYILLISDIADMEAALLHIRATLELDEYWHGISTSDYIITMPVKRDAARKAKILQQKIPCNIGVGNHSPSLRESLDQAKLAVRYGKIFHQEAHLYRYDAYAFIHLLSGIQDTGMQETMQILSCDCKNMDLPQTLRTLFSHNGDITATAQAMFVHRNTLKYRLDKVAEITGKDPRCYQDLFYLYVALVQDSLQHNADAAIPPPTP